MTASTTEPTDKVANTHAYSKNVEDDEYSYSSSQQREHSQPVFTYTPRVSDSDSDSRSESPPEPQPKPSKYLSKESVLSAFNLHEYLLWGYIRFHVQNYSNDSNSNEIKDDNEMIEYRLSSNSSSLYIPLEMKVICGQYLGFDHIIDSSILNDTQKNALFDLLSNQLSHKKHIQYFTKLQLLFRGSLHGFNSDIFHKRIDFKENNIFVVRTVSGHVFGGYTFVPWMVMKDPKFCSSKHRAMSDSDAFLFLLEIGDGIRAMPEYKNVELPQIYPIGKGLQAIGKAIILPHENASSLLQFGNCLAIVKFDDSVPSDVKHTCFENMNTYCINDVLLFTGNIEIKQQFYIQELEMFHIEYRAFLDVNSEQ